VIVKNEKMLHDDQYTNVNSMIIVIIMIVIMALIMRTWETMYGSVYKHDKDSNGGRGRGADDSAIK
jgi:FtsZ-interacting cell division protein ZipA